MTLYTRGFSHFVTSMTAPVASGRSDSCRVGLAPTEERRLAAILAADVVGYSRLIRADEEGTIAALKALRADVVDPKLGEPWHRPA